MLFKNFLSFKISFKFFVDFFNDSSFFFDELVQLFVFVIGKLWNVIFVFRIISDNLLFLFFIVLLVFILFILFVIVFVIVVIGRILHCSDLMFKF